MQYAIIIFQMKSVLDARKLYMVWHSSAHPSTAVSFPLVDTDIKAFCVAFSKAGFSLSRIQNFTSTTKGKSAFPFGNVITGWPQPDETDYLKYSDKCKMLPWRMYELTSNSAQLQMTHSDVQPVLNRTVLSWTAFTSCL